MTFTTALAGLYAVSGIAGCACYLPQLIRLARSADARRAMSLATWGGWLGLGGITLVYAAVLGQPEMLLVNSLNSACQAAVVAMVAAQRFADWKTNGHRSPSAPPHGRSA